MGYCKSLGFLYLTGIQREAAVLWFHFQCGNRLSPAGGCARPDPNDQSMDHTVVGSAFKIPSSVSVR